MRNFIQKVPSEIWLVLAALMLLGGWLSGHGIWTQEYRWQQVCLHMMQSGDYLHPYLDGKPYYDKPLLSYWIIIVFAKINGGVLSNTVLRLPSLLAALVTLWACYQINYRFFGRKTALLTGWLLLTTFYFIFWARVASSDILNIMAIMVCCWWFIYQANQRLFWQDLVFFIFMALAALLKGLIAPAIVFLVVLPVLYRHQRWKSYLAFKPLLAMMIALVIYLTPFMLSSYTGAHYQENGLVEVFRENILRFFKPFDHAGGIGTYFIYAPVYSLPWFPLWFIPLFRRVKQWADCLPGEKWLIWAVLIIFVFLSASGSRRSYYILPIVPFAIMLAAYYGQQIIDRSRLAARYFIGTIAFFYVAYVVYFVIAQPVYYIHHSL